MVSALQGGGGGGCGWSRPYREEGGEDAGGLRPTGKRGRRMRVVFALQGGGGEGGVSIGQGGPIRALGDSAWGEAGPSIGFREASHLPVSRSSGSPAGGEVEVPEFQILGHSRQVDVTSITVPVSRTSEDLDLSEADAPTPATQQHIVHTRGVHTVNIP